MAFAFDTLSYAKTLRSAGIPLEQAEAHAAAAREFIMQELVTKEDLRTAMELQTLRMTVRLDDLRAAMDKIALQTTVRLGGLVAAGFAALAALIKLH